MGHDSNHPHPHSHTRKKQTAIHKDWRAWTVVVLMLGAMTFYLFSMDEEIQPEGAQQTPIEALDAE